MGQMDDGQFTAALDGEMNSVAVIVKHLSGNMRSRFTDFLTTDGEKPDRNRDTEFAEPPVTRAEVMAMWETGWGTVFSALDGLTDEDMTRVVTIRGERHSVMQAINRQATHYAYHCGQIVFLAKHLSAAKWTALTVPRGESARFNAQVASGEKSQR